MLNLPVTIKNDVQVMSSIDLAKLCVGKSKDAHSDFMKKAKKVLGDALGDFSERESYGNNNTRTILLLPEREACLMAMSYSYELQAYVFDEWQKLKNQAKPKWMMQLSPEATIALNDLSNQLESKTKKVEQLESLFHSGGTIAQFAKQLNGLNSQQINNWLYSNTNWLYDENKGKIHLSGRKQGHPKRPSWRCASYARDKYLTESPRTISKQGFEEITKYEVQLLDDGKKWLFDKYIAGKLPMKSNWNGEFTHKKDLD